MLKNNEFELYRKWTVALTFLGMAIVALVVSYAIVAVIVA